MSWSLQQPEIRFSAKKSQYNVKVVILSFKLAMKVASLVYFEFKMNLTVVKVA